MCVCLLLLSVCVSHGWVLVQAEASQWAQACLINSSDRYEELKVFSPLSSPASQTLTHTDWQSPAGTTCYWCLDSGVWAVDSTTHTHTGFMLILRCDYWLRSPDTCIMDPSFLSPGSELVLWRYHTGYELINRGSHSPSGDASKPHIWQTISSVTHSTPFIQLRLEVIEKNILLSGWQGNDTAKILWLFCQWYFTFSQNRMHAQH